MPRKNRSPRAHRRCRRGQDVDAFGPAVRTLAQDRHRRRVVVAPRNLANVCMALVKIATAMFPRVVHVGHEPEGIPAVSSPTNSALGRLWHIAVAVDGVGQLMASSEERQGYGLPLLSGGRNSSAVDLAERLVGRLYLLPLLLPRSLLLVDTGDTERLRGGRLVMKRHMDRLGGRATGGTRSIVVETVATGTEVTAGHLLGIFPIRHLAIVIRQVSCLPAVHDRRPV